MAVYVNELHKAIKNENWKWEYVSHLMADSILELNNFAIKIGLKMEWYQHKTIPHYDLTKRKYKRAIKNGAKLIKGKELLEHIQKQRII